LSRAPPGPIIDRRRAEPEPRSKPAIAVRFAAARYAYVLQDCRGRYASEGVFTKYLDEASDGSDTPARLLDPSRCNGRVGTLGLSYGAHVQKAMVTGSPGLAAMSSIRTMGE